MFECISFSFTLPAYVFVFVNVCVWFFPVIFSVSENSSYGSIVLGLLAHAKPFPKFDRINNIKLVYTLLLYLIK